MLLSFFGVIFELNAFLSQEGQKGVIRLQSSLTFFNIDGKMSNILLCGASWLQVITVHSVSLPSSGPVQFCSVLPTIVSIPIKVRKDIE